MRRKILPYLFIIVVVAGFLFPYISGVGIALICIALSAIVFFLPEEKNHEN